MMVFYLSGFVGMKREREREALTEEECRSY